MNLVYKRSIRDFIQRKQDLRHAAPNLQMSKTQRRIWGGHNLGTKAGPGSLQASMKAEGVLLLA